MASFAPSTDSTSWVAASMPSARNVAPMIASMASARIDGFSRPPESSSPLPSRRCSPTPRPSATSARATEFTTVLRISVRAPFVEVGVHAVHVIGDDHAEHGVAEELEPLVRGVAGVLRAPRAVHESGGEEVGREVEAEALDELRELGYRKGDERS